MKKLLAFSFALLTSIIYAQNISITIHIELENQKCTQSGLERTLELEKNTDGTYFQVYALSTTNCKNTYNVPKITGNYRLKINAKGFLMKIINFEVSSQTSQLDLGNIVLLEDKFVELEAVSIVKGKKQYMKVDAEKTTYLVKGNPMLNTGSISDAIKRLPGVFTSPSGDAVLNGKAVAIYIDGIPSSLSGSDLQNYIASLPANTVKKIELIENPGASYEANTSGGIINIITYSETLKGFSGTFNLHYGVNRWSKPSPSVILNGRTNKINWQLQTGYNYHESENTTESNRIYTLFNPNVLIFQKNYSENINRNFYFRPMVNFKVGEKSSIIVNYNTNIVNNSSATIGNSFSENYTDNFILINNLNNKNKNNNHEFIAKYKTELDSLGKNLQIVSYYSKYHKKDTNNSIENLNSTNNYSINDIDLDLNDFYVKYDFELPFKKLKFGLNTGGKFRILNSNTFGRYNLNNYSEDIFQSKNFTNQLDFDYDETSYALYTELKKKFGKLSVTAGLRMEDLSYKSKVAETGVKVDKHINNFFPTFHTLYELASELNLIGSYTRKINVPPYSQLDPNNSGYFDSFTSSTGNQFLNPNFHDNYSFKISAFNYLQLGVNYSYAKNVNLEIFDSQENSLFTQRTFKTFKNINQYGIYTTVPIPFGLITQGKDFFKKTLDIDKLSGIYFYGSYNNHKISDYVYNFERKPLWVFSIMSQFILPFDLKLNLTYFNLSKGTYGIYDIQKPIKNLNLDLTRKFLNNKLTASISIQDMLNQNEINAFVPSTYINSNFHQKADTRVFWFKLSYNFGKLKNDTEIQIDSEKKEVERKGIEGTLVK